MTAPARPCGGPLTRLPDDTMTIIDRRPTAQLWVPAYFWADHADRCPCDNPETDMATELREAGRRVLIEGTPQQIETLRSDAAFYCDRDGPDEAPAALKRSARATIDAIRRASASSPARPPRRQADDPSPRDVVY